MIKLTSRPPVAMALALLLAASVACQTVIPLSAGERFIQGTWSWGQDFGDGHGSYLEWTFDAGGFTVEGYPPLQQTGQYRVVAETGDTLTLKLTKQAGDWPTDDREMIVVLDRAADTITLDNSGPFNRVVDLAQSARRPASANGGF